MAVSVSKYGAKGIGRDEFHALQKALDREKELFFPKGLYILSDTLRIPSDRTLIFEEGAVLKLRAGTPRKRGDFLLTNKNHDTGDKNITLIGGTFDGNNGYFRHKRPKDIFCPDGYSGVLIDFNHVEGLTLKGLTLCNPVAYYTRFCRIDRFLIEDITLKSKRTLPNQDGIHFAGEVKNGTVKNIRAATYGQTNDDLLALNADDFPGRIEEFDTVCGPIENILFEDIFAESCHDAVRLLSFRSAIKNIIFRNLNIGFRECAVDANAARGCRAELFKEDEEPFGVGRIERVTFSDCTFWHTTEYPLFWKGSKGNKPHPLIRWGSLADKVRFDNCRFVPAPPYQGGYLAGRINARRRVGIKKEDFPAFRLSLVPMQQVVTGREAQKAIKKEDVVTVPDFRNLSLDLIKPL